MSDADQRKPDSGGGKEWTETTEICHYCGTLQSPGLCVKCKTHTQSIPSAIRHAHNAALKCKYYREVTTPTDKTISGAAVGMLEPVEVDDIPEVKELREAVNAASRFMDYLRMKPDSASTGNDPSEHEFRFDVCQKCGVSAFNLDENEPCTVAATPSGGETQTHRKET